MGYVLIADADKSHNVVLTPDRDIDFVNGDTFILSDAADYYEVESVEQAVYCVQKAGVPNVLFLNFDLADGDGLAFLENLKSQHVAGKIDLIKIKLFRQCTGSYAKDEKLYNWWWKFHEEFLNKRELEKEQK